MIEDDVIVCRCEEVTAGAIREAIRVGACDLAGIKRRTRAGMGLCQGRSCERIVVQLLCEQLKATPEYFEFDRVRAPLLPVALAALAGEIDDEDG
jgi:NAD(P)H-nitrite reductase large subunit